MHHQTDFFKGKRAVKRRCPNEGNACNCIGVCHPIWVDKDDPRTDDQVRSTEDKKWEVFHRERQQH